MAADPYAPPAHPGTTLTNTQAGTTAKLPQGSHQLPDGTWVDGNGAPLHLDANGVPDGGVVFPDGGYSKPNDHGTVDLYNADGSLRRPGASAPQGAPGFDQDHAGFAGVDDWVNVGLAPVTGGTSLISGSPTQLPGNAAQGAADAAMNGDSIIEGTWNGIKNDPSVQSVAGTVDKAASGIGDLLGTVGGGGKIGKVDPYRVTQPAPINSTPFTQPLTDLSSAARASGTNWAGQQGDLAKQLLAAPSVAQAQGNAMAERTAQENAAQLASARGANTALLLRQAAGSADARTRGIVSDLATASAQENVDRNKAAAGMLNQAAGTENAGLNTAINATGTGAQIGADVAKTNNANALAGEGINAGSYDATNATNAGIGRDANASRDKWIDRALTVGGALLTASDINNKQNIQPAPQRFGDMLALAADPQGNRQTLAPVEPAVYQYKPETAAMPGNDAAPRPGVMAQDLMKSPAGDATVVDTPSGKGIDVNRGLSLALASSAGLDKRVAELEALLKQDDEKKRQLAELEGVRSAASVPGNFTQSLRDLGRYSPPRAGY